MLKSRLLFNGEGDDDRTLFLNPSVKISLTSQYHAQTVLDIFVYHVLSFGV